MLARTRSGGVAINDTVVQAAVEGLPFGGLGASGIGAYHGRSGFDTFSHRRAVFLQSRLSGTRLLRPPYGRIAHTLLKRMIGSAIREDEDDGAHDAALITRSTSRTSEKALRS